MKDFAIGVLVITGFLIAVGVIAGEIAKYFVWIKWLFS